jgi:membrane protein
VKRLSQIHRFLDADIWELQLRNISPARAFVVRYLRVAVLALRGFVRDDCSKTASFLTYYSLLNVVPLLAVAFAIAKGFGLRRLMEQQILQMADRASLQPDVTSQIVGFSHSILNQAKGGLIAGVGVMLLFWTVISILGKIEDAFNAIWGVQKPRTLVRKFSDYMAMLVLAPILLVISSSVTLLVASKLKEIVRDMGILGNFSAVIFLLLNLLPYVTIWALLAVLYVIMPNTRVPLWSAIRAGVVAGTMYQVVQWIYIKFQIGVAGYGAVYGSFAALPLFLAWLQTSWVIVLIGFEFAAADGHYETFGFHPDYRRINHASRKFLLLRVFHLLVRGFARGEKPATTHEIAYALEIPIRLVRHLLSGLMNAGLVVEVVGEKNSGATFQPGRSIEDITIMDALDACEEGGKPPLPIPPSEEAERISSYLKEISELIENSPANVRLKDI